MSSGQCERRWLKKDYSEIEAQNQCDEDVVKEKIQDKQRRDKDQVIRKKKCCAEAKVESKRFCTDPQTVKDIQCPAPIVWRHNSVIADATTNKGKVDDEMKDDE
jgi:hypothetical protein